MNHRIALCAGLTVFAVAAATSAPAQTYAEPPGAMPPPSQGTLPPAPPVHYRGLPPAPVEHGGMPPGEALMIARASGLRPLTQPARQGANWVLLASDNMGGQLRVMIDARSGRIVHASPAYDPRFASAPMRPRGYVPMPGPQHDTVAPPPGYGTARDLREPSAPLPPSPRTAARTPQNPSLASAPETTGTLPPPRPARTPLPRPRPTMAANEGGAGAAAPTPPMQSRQVVETSPEAEAPTPAPAAAPAAAPAKQPPAETQMIPVAPLD